DFGLEAALDRLAGVVGDRSPFTVDVNVALPEGLLPPEHETAIYRIVQEALTNVVKHASATRVSIVVAGSARAVRAVIEDDGVGFAPGRVREHALGLIGRRGRPQLLGGRLVDGSAPGAGPTVVVEIPLH